jgi:hypothetical protein
VREHHRIDHSLIASIIITYRPWFGTEVMVLLAEAAPKAEGGGSGRGGAEL